MVGGVFRSLAQGAAERGIALIPQLTGSKYQPHGWFGGQLAAGIPFDPFRMAAYLDERMVEAGVDVRLLIHFVESIVEHSRITHLLLFNKSGLAAVKAKAVVDATGDADVAARSACEVVQGRESDGLMTPTSLIFHVSHVDQDAPAEAIERDDFPRLREKIAELRASGEWSFPYDNSVPPTISRQLSHRQVDQYQVDQRSLLLRPGKSVVAPSRELVGGEELIDRPIGDGGVGRGRTGRGQA